MEKITGNMASIPSRRAHLEKVVESITGQVDQLNVYLNGYPEVPEFLDHPRIRVDRSQEFGDRGDAGKFFRVDETEGYFLSLDDDILYPEGYAGRIVNGIERWGRRAAVGMHGEILKNVIRRWSRDRLKMFHFVSPLKSDRQVHLLGTGVAGFHSGTLRLSRDHFALPNMADVWFALACHRQQIPRVVLAHPADWLKILPVPEAETLWGQTRHREEIHREDIVPEVRIIQECLPWPPLTARPDRP